MSKDHCVIGSEAHGRTWGTEEESVAYAKRLIAQKGCKLPLFIVKIVKVVELSAPPIEVRDFSPADTK